MIPNLINRGCWIQKAWRELLKMFPLAGNRKAICIKVHQIQRSTPMYLLCTSWLPWSLAVWSNGSHITPSPPPPPPSLYWFLSSPNIIARLNTNYKPRATNQARSTIVRESAIRPLMAQPEGGEEEIFRTSVLMNTCQQYLYWYSQDTIVIKWS